MRAPCEAGASSQLTLLLLAWLLQLMLALLHSLPAVVPEYKQEPADAADLLLPHGVVHLLTVALPRPQQPAQRRVLVPPVRSGLQLQP
jgi:hypothetical protein